MLLFRPAHELLKRASCILRPFLLLSVLGLAGLVHPAMGRACLAGELWSVEPRPEQGQLQINLRGKPFATYSYRDAAVSRPYFANIYAPSGVKITRNHPPAPKDPQDHDKMHPGMWLAFGDLSGADSWRLKAPVEHVRFVEAPRAEGGVLEFAVMNRYLATDRRELCQETCRYELHALPNGVLVLWDSVFRSDNDRFTFGDQEELGLGVRLAREIAVKADKGGRILNSNGQRNEAEAWGQQADWCDYSGTIDGQFVGITIMPHPKSFRRAWCHCRDTGFMAMNPFGRNAFTGGEKSEVIVEPGEGFHLRYGVLIHRNDSPDEFDADQNYRDYLQRQEATEVTETTERVNR